MYIPGCLHFFQCYTQEKKSHSLGVRVWHVHPFWYTCTLKFCAHVQSPYHEPHHTADSLSYYVQQNYVNINTILTASIQLWLGVIIYWGHAWDLGLVICRPIIPRPSPISYGIRSSIVWGMRMGVVSYYLNWTQSRWPQVRCLVNTGSKQRLIA